MPINTDNLIEIFESVKNAMNREEDRIAEDIQRLSFTEFLFPQESQATSFTAIDGSYTSLWRVGTTSIVAIRVAAITYDKDFRIVSQDCSDRVALVSFDESVKNYINDETMRQILHITSSSSAFRETVENEKETEETIDTHDVGMHSEFETEKSEPSVETGVQSYAAKDRTEFAAELYMVAKEFEMAEKVSGICSNTIVAIDGALKRRSEAPFKEYIDRTIGNCVENQSVFIGIVKGTSRSSLKSMFLDETYAETIAKRKKLRDCWYVEVPGEVKIRYAKLHPFAVKPFRIDIHEKTVNTKAWCRDIPTVIRSVAYYASNELCLGYPFPSAQAHQLAVTLRHMFPALQSLCLEAALKSGFSYKEVFPYLTSMYGATRNDFHLQLDMISKKGKGSQIIRGSTKG